MRNTRLEIRPLTGNIGAEVFGADLANLDDAQFAEIHDALMEHLVLCIRDQDITPEHHKAFGRRFGPLNVHPYLHAARDRSADPEILEIRKEPGETYVNGNGWHIDHPWKEKSLMGAALYCLEVPDSGGDTMFTNLRLAYETLTDGLKETLSRLNAVHVANPELYRGDPNISMSDEEIRQLHATHPVVRTHPVTGRKGLFLNPSTTRRFEGWSEAESRPLLEYLFRHCIKEEFTCRVRWRKGSLTVWDNRCTMHNALDDYAGKRRHMMRVAIESTERPV